jgi:hypothetical protein
MTTGGGGGQAQTPLAPGRDTGRPPAAARHTTRAPRRRLTGGQRRAFTIGAGAVALVTFALAGLGLARDCRGRDWEAVALEFAGDLPLDGARRSGPEVAGTLRDPAWPNVAAEKRRDQMSAALRALPDDVEVFFVRDPAGNLLASARWYGKVPRQIAVTLR